MKFYGLIGFAKDIKKNSGVWEDEIDERPYFGDIIRNVSQVQTSDKVNDDISVSNGISIVADPYANNNFQNMKYVKFMGSAWKVIKVEVKYPRLIVTVGGVYNGKKA